MLPSSLRKKNTKMSMHPEYVIQSIAFTEEGKMPAPGTNSSSIDYYVTILIEVTSAASRPA